MQPRSSSSRTPIIAGILAGLLAAGLGAYYVYQPQPSPAGSSNAPATQDADAKAVDALMALPEIKAWSSHIEKASKGRAHGAVMETAPEQRLVDGKPYYQLSFFENTPDAAHRWESFLVSPDGKRILVEDLASDELFSLERWRKESKPMERAGN